MVALCWCQVRLNWFYLLKGSTVSITLNNMVISFFQSKEEKDELITKIKNGDLHIIVGTHALLTERMAYNNLGLLVVDEEQVLLWTCCIFFRPWNVCLLCCYLCLVAVLVWWCYALFWSWRFGWRARKELIIWRLN